MDYPPPPTPTILPSPQTHKHSQTEEEAAQLEGVSVRLRETIRSLWERLEVPQPERDLFSEHHQGYKPKVIATVSE